ncbi:hypothetical protein ACFLWG_04255 [Chloroflexota bacterium]
MAVDVNVLPSTFSIIIGIFGALAAAGTVVVAWVAIKTLRNTIEDRKRDLKQRRIEDIHKWAQDINEYSMKRRTEAVAIGSESLFLRDQREELFEIYEPFRSKTVYTETVAKLVSARLLEAVIEVRKLLQEQISNLHNLRKDTKGTILRGTDMEIAKILSDKLNEIHKAAVNVIIEVAEADVSDLSQ